MEGIFLGGLGGGALGTWGGGVCSNAAANLRTSLIQKGSMKAGKTICLSVRISKRDTICRTHKARS